MCIRDRRGPSDQLQPAVHLHLHDRERARAGAGVRNRDAAGHLRLSLIHISYTPLMISRMNCAPVAAARSRLAKGSHRTFTPKGILISCINSPDVYKRQALHVLLGKIVLVEVVQPGNDLLQHLGRGNQEHGVAHVAVSYTHLALMRLCEPPLELLV